MLTLMALPSVFGPVASVVSAVLALVAGLTFSRQKNVRPYDVDRELADLTLKVRRPWQYRAMRISRWMDGD